MNRRRFIGTGLLSATAIAGHRAHATQAHVADETFKFEIVRSDSEWRSHLEEDECAILRGRETEPKHYSDHTTEMREGTYCCRGCDLTLYDSEWKVPLDIGWVFFRHSRPHAIVTSIDPSQNSVNGMAFPEAIPIVSECRRCGSHLGHIVYVRGALLHCINGTSLSFAPKET